MNIKSAAIATLFLAAGCSAEVREGFGPPVSVGIGGAGGAGGSAGGAGGIDLNLPERSPLAASIEGYAAIVDGFLYLWGTVEGETIESPLLFPDVVAPIEVSSAVLTTCALTASSDLYCWGDLPVDPPRSSVVPRLIEANTGGDRGPLVILLDESGSMGGNKAQRGIWAKAAAVAMIRIAWEDGRSARVVHYARGVSITTCMPGDTRSLLTVMSHWLGGGTRIAEALDEGARSVEFLTKSGQEGSDVVLVTDGLDRNTADRFDKAVDAIEAQGAQLWTVAIESHIKAESALRKRAKRFVEIGGADLTSDKLGGMEGAVL